MSEIPADVIEAGNRFADLFGDGRQGYTAFDIAVLAIMAERERCAEVAEAQSTEWRSAQWSNKEYVNGRWQGADVIAVAIRKGCAA